jgi:predicted nuclease with TOPRIM domain
MGECQACIQKDKDMEEAAKVMTQMTAVVEEARKRNKELTKGLRESCEMIKRLVGDLTRVEGAIQKVGPRQMELKKANDELRMKLIAANQVMEKVLIERNA